MAEPFLSRFTPSLMDAETLEAIFVQREPLAQRLVDLVRESVTSRSSQHSLLIGPRGIGKTHMVALVYHRLRSDKKLGRRLLIAWLREEEWGVGSFLDLLMRILAALRSEYGETGFEELNTLYDLPPDEAERRAANLLVRYLGKRNLLVILENLDDIFAGLGAAEQRRFRAFLQEHNRISLLATSQSLFNGVSLQTSPFYGFFRIHHLNELEFQDAVRLLVQLAELTGKADLAASLQTPEGRARIRAVHHLAGGNPRVYVIFSQFLTRESLEELVSPFMRLLDDLTPYYQARMAWISPQQRKIVDFLCERRGAVPVKEIARHCFVSHQTTSSQLKDLKELGYVRSLAVGRESYYELREPLMRLCMEVKSQRGEPIKSLVDFLRWWYSRRELEDRLNSLGCRSLDRDYIVQALQRTEAEMDQASFRAWLAMLIQELPSAQRAVNEWERDVASEPEPLVAFWVRLFGHCRKMECHLEEVVDLLAQAKACGQPRFLGACLVEACWNYPDSEPPSTKLRAWLELWIRVGAQQEELRVPLRLLVYTLRYLETHDDCILLELPVEERTVVEMILDRQSARLGGSIPAVDRRGPRRLVAGTT